jgi:hypothetical protein
VKPQIYKVGIEWILWVPGERVYRFAEWQDALNYALDAILREQTETPLVHSATNAN